MFRKSKLVSALLDHGQATGFGLNELAYKYYKDDGYQDEWMQLAQLIGYSVSAFGGLSYASEEVTHKADLIAEELERPDD